MGREGTRTTNREHNMTDSTAAALTAALLADALTAEDWMLDTAGASDANLTAYAIANLADGLREDAAYLVASYADGCAVNIATVRLAGSILANVAGWATATARM